MINLLDLPLELLVKIFSYVGYNRELFRTLSSNNVMLQKAFSFIPCYDQVNLDDGYWHLSPYNLDFLKYGRYLNLFIFYLKNIPRMPLYPDQHLTIHNACDTQLQGLGKKLSNLGSLKIPVNPNRCYLDLSDMHNLYSLELTWITFCPVEIGCVTYKCRHTIKPTKVYLPKNLTKLTLADINFDRINPDFMLDCESIKTFGLRNCRKFIPELLGKTLLTVTSLTVSSTYISIGEITRNFPNLEKVHYDGSLKITYLTRGKGFDNIDTSIILECNPKLEFLCLSNTHSDPDGITQLPHGLKEVILDNVIIYDLIFPTTVRSITIKDSKFGHHWYNDPLLRRSFVRNLSNCTNLETLKLNVPLCILDVEAGFKNIINTLTHVDIKVLTNDLKQALPMSLQEIRSRLAN